MHSTSNEIHALLSDIKNSPSPFHTVFRASEKLKANGFLPLAETQRWKLEPGNAYFTVRNDSSLIAFRLPHTVPDACLITAGHSDSPAFKLKEFPELRTNPAYVRLNTEKYGGMMFYTWLDRPLSVAGRIFLSQDHSIRTKLVDLKEPCAVIPSLAIHYNRKINQEYAFSPAKDLIPLYSLNPSAETIACRIARAAGISPEQITGSDLYLYNAQEPFIWGNDDELFSAPRIDDLECVFTGLSGFLEAAPSPRAIQLYSVFDNEEVGSRTRQGAASTFLRDVLDRIFAQLLPDTEAEKILLANSLMLSADNAHALHPNFPETSDPVNRPLMNQGIVLKQNAEQKYTTDGYSAAYCRSIAKQANCRLQVLTNRSDMPGGSTLGSISNTVVSVPTADIGLAQLAMHSSFETAGTFDAAEMQRFIKAFYESR